MNRSMIRGYDNSAPLTPESVLSAGCTGGVGGGVHAVMLKINPSDPSRDPGLG